MTNKTLEQLYAEHMGKVSDKWSIYFNEYDRILGAYRNKPVRLLEIGIQNGGSLEIWSKYFPHAQKLVGCDINPDCARLSYEDPRIAVVVGDVNSDTAQAKVLGYAPAFDVIIDDGAHHSSDIVKSFARYFPHLADDGVFVAEDLHCSYWREFEGGLFDPFSSITFFKRLADVISHEHWGIEKNRADIFSGFFSKYDFQIDEETLQHVHSVEFINSMCVIRKAKPERNRLGSRIIAGSVEMVAPGHLGLHGWQSSPAPALDQTGNVWTARSMPPDEELLLRIKELADRDGQIASLHQAVSERDSILVERDGQIAGLYQAVVERDGQIAALYNSTSWRVTSLLRTVAHQVERARRATELVMRAIKRVGGLKSALKKAVQLYRRQGLAGIKRPFRIVATSGQPVIPDAARSIEIDYSLSVPFSFSVLPNSGLGQTAAIIHLYYEDLAGEFRSYLENVSVSMDIYISTTDSFRKNVIEKAFEGWSRGSIEVRVVPNRGRDIAPKLVSFRDIYERYTYVLHLHTKRSHHAVLASWRHFLLENLIGTKEVVQSVFQAFERNPSLGIIASQHFEPMRQWVNWGGNFKTANQLASKMGFSINEYAPLDFPSGSMFWARSAALRPLLDLNLRTDEFDEERGQSDGTLAHAIERIYFHACEHAGYDWLKIARLELFAHTPAIVRTSRVSDLDSFFSRHLFRLLDPRGIEPRTVRQIPVERRIFDIVRDRVLGINLKVQPTTRVAIGLVTYNNRDDEIHSAIGAAHLSLQRTGVNTEGGLFILDNGSNTEAATSGNPFVVRLPREGNIGYGAGHNRLMRAAFDAGAEIYIAINPDGILHPDAVLALVQMAQAASGKALVEALQFPLEHPKPYDAVTLDTPWVAGACLAIPRSAFEDLGGFDENFFMYCEDVDISWRARANGYALKTCPRALFLHAVTNREQTPTTLKMIFESGIILARKWRAVEFERWLRQELAALGFPAPSISPVIVPEEWRRYADFSNQFSFAQPRW